MTNEEAKKMLKAKLECLKNETSGINYDCNMRLCDGCSLNYEQGNMGEQKEALDLAIKALEQEPCEKCEIGNPCLYCEYDFTEKKTKESCDDCISRKAVKEMLTAEWTKYMPMELDINLSFVLDKISALPSVTPSYNSVKTELDCISRQAVLEYIEGSGAELGHGSENELVCQDIKNLPSVTPQTRWIPVSERLPERDINVLAYHRNISFDYQYVSWIDDYSGRWCGFIGNLSDDVVAWMPLPSSYQGESEDEG